MVGLRISPFRGLMTFWFASGYNLFIRSGLKKMPLKVNQENMLVTYLFRLKILCDGYLIVNQILSDGLLIKQKL